MIISEQAVYYSKHNYINKILIIIVEETMLKLLHELFCHLDTKPNMMSTYKHYKI